MGVAGPGTILGTTWSSPEKASRTTTAVGRWKLAASWDFGKRILDIHYVESLRMICSDLYLGS